MRRSILERLRLALRHRGGPCRAHVPPPTTSPAATARTASSSSSTTTSSSSASPSTPPPPPPTPAAAGPHVLLRLQSRLPPRLRPYTAPLLTAPVSHVTSFLVLHELTAILPLLGIFGLLHYSYATVASSSSSSLDGGRGPGREDEDGEDGAAGSLLPGLRERTTGLLEWVQRREAYTEGVKRWGRYARRKGWVEVDEDDAAGGAGGDGGVEVATGPTTMTGGDAGQGEVTASTGAEARVRSDDGAAGQKEGPFSSSSSSSSSAAASPGAGPAGARVVVELATAYALTKLFLPVRIAVSVWATPWFARVVVRPVGRLARGVVGR